MGKGTIFKDESRVFKDEKTGARIRQVTQHESIHHHPFYYLPAFDQAMHHLVVVSHRSGKPQIYLEIQDGNVLVQLTEREDLSEWSVHPSYDGRYVYFTAGTGAWRVDTESFKEEQLADFGEIAMKEKGMVGAAMGTTTVSHDDRYWAIPIKVGEVSRFCVLDTSSGALNVILECDSIGHPEFHPDDSEWLRYAGPYTNRMWVIKRDGTNHRLVYERDVSKKQWIVHETWRPGSRELVTSDWPHGMIGVDVDTGAVRKVCSFNAWHASINASGTQMVADTNFPDNGLQVFDPMDGIGHPEPLCESLATNEGQHWDTDHCPYDDGPIQVYAPQHTHPHPAFSPDGNKVVFTSDRSGFAQVYVVDV